MLKLINSKLHRRSKSRHSLLIKTYPKSIHPAIPNIDANGSSAAAASFHPCRSVSESDTEVVVIIRVATFNAALFSMAPAVVTKTTEPASTKSSKSNNFSLPKSILKNPNQKPRHKPNLRVSINLPENEISLPRDMKLKSRFPLVNGEDEKQRRSGKKKAFAEVLRELNVDVLALQDVKADEENEMKPLSELAEALDLNYYVFAESWAPQFGNAVLSRWPIKKFDIQKLLETSDFRNVIKATIDVPGAGELNFFCTHLDHLDEEWRLKQLNMIIEGNKDPHLLAGNLNYLCETDYSSERWTDIVKYYQEMGKPMPKADVMRFIKNKQYFDVKDFAGEFEPVVIIAKGQSVQGTCKYGTRMDYLLASPGFPFEFVPGSYSVYSSQGTSDHHIVKADIVKRIKDTKSLNLIETQ